MKVGTKVNWFKNLKIKNKILFLVTIVILLSLIPIITVSYNNSLTMLKNVAGDIAENNYKIIDLQLDIQKNDLLNSASLITVRNVPKKAIENKNFNLLQNESIPKAINESTAKYKNPRPEPCPCRTLLHNDPERPWRRSHQG